MLFLVVVVGLARLEPDTFRTLIASVGRVFAVVAVLAGIDLAATGFILAQGNLQSWSALFQSSFGHTLLAKVGLALLTGLVALVHVWTGRQRARLLLLASRALAGVAFVATLAIFWLSASLATG